MKFSVQEGLFRTFDVSGEKRSWQRDTFDIINSELAAAYLNYDFI